MVAPDSEPKFADSTPNAPPGQAAMALEPATTGARTLGLALAAGLLAGTLGWLAGEAILEAYRGDLTPKFQRSPDPETLRRFARARVLITSSTFAALGAVLGVGLGVAGGLARRSVPAGVRAAIVGLASGAAAGFSVALLVLPGFFERYDPLSHELTDPLLTIGAIASAVGAAGGLAFGVGLGGRERWLKALVGGLLGAALGATLYEIFGAVALPTGGTDLPISNTPLTRALLHLGVATLAAAGSVLALGLSARGRDATPPAP